ncbi:hypothetical protein HY992_02480 [Candidatus Micrarchaeota archaeon]|nr:hypothetical protein [Candidatus Micrarchaeota archaeon]
MNEKTFTACLLLVSTLILFSGCAGNTALPANETGNYSLNESANASNNSSVVCAQVISYAVDPVGGDCIEFPTSCTPEGWRTCVPAVVSQKLQEIENQTFDEAFNASGDERIEIKNSVFNAGFNVTENALVAIYDSKINEGAVRASKHGNIKFINCELNENATLEASDNAKIFVSTILSPEDNATVSGNVSISGSAFQVAGEGDLFDYYELKYGYIAPGETLPARWHSISNNTKQVKTGLLGEWDTFGLMNGNYTLALRIVDEESRVNTATKKVQITSGLPA